MTDIEIKQFARRRTLKGTAVLLGVLIILLLMGETRGDFANGILFFVQGITNIHTLVILTILFGLTYFFAGSAGKEIITERQNILLISLKYVILISLAMSIYVTIIAFSRRGDHTPGGFKSEISLYFVPLFLKIDLSLLIVWLWATNKMRLVKA